MTTFLDICKRLLIVFLLLFASNTDVIADVAGLPDAEALRLGEAMYVKGVLPSGRPMQAVVQGDIEVSGTMITCSRCHMRSGLGAFEGMVLVPPVNGSKLYAPLVNPLDFPGSAENRTVFQNSRGTRGGYTDKTLAAALRNGTDPAGRVMHEAMPRYILDDREMEILIFYLKNLSPRQSPGVTAEGVRFATVVAGNVREEDRRSLIEPLKAFINEEWNARLSLARSSNFYRDDAYRPISLDVWELKGSPDTWGPQLDALYTRQPVFAVLGGLSSGSLSSGPWGPIHSFCEKNGLPCILPVTNLPVVSESDRYTVYYSKGYFQEGEAAAKYLARGISLPDDRQVIQVYRDRDEGSALAKGFSDQWKKLGKTGPVNRIIPSGQAVDGNFWKELGSAHDNAVIMVWLDPDDLAGIEALAGSPKRPSMVFVSSTMLGGSLSLLPEAVRDFTLITYPARLPGETEVVSSVVDTWLKFKKIQKTDPEIAARTFFLTRTVATALRDMRGDFYRDYFLELIDGQGDRSATAAFFPRVNFSPGRRYASNGCYIVSLTKGENPKIVRQSEWIVY